MCDPQHTNTSTRTPTHNPQHTMPNKQSLTPTELLLQLLEFASLGSLSVDQAARQIRRAHPFTRATQKVARGFEMLEGEGLVARTVAGDRPGYRVTPAGVATLEKQGRYPTGATVIFTDIVGSTSLIATFGEDGAHDRRQRHFALLRRVIEAHGGREVKNLGDGLMIVFADPVAAVRCAAAMQRKVTENEDQLGLRVGLNTGELLREDGDYFGTTVIVAQRLCDRAEQGQVVVSDDTRGAAAGDRELRFEPQGQMDLKGLRTPVLAWSLDWPDAAAPPRRRAVRETSSAAD